MTSKLILHDLTFSQHNVQIYVPDYTYIQERYLLQKEEPFPYWAKLWPASMALTQFIASNTHYILNKNVLELAAGLGLPSIVAATYAAEVTCSDYLQEPLDVIDNSISVNNLTNIHTRILNWHSLPANITVDVLLLSDINYDEKEFDVLYKVLQRFIENNTAILLSTPQRLIAKGFIERLQPWIQHQEEIKIETDGEITYVSVFVLTK